MAQKTTSIQRLLVITLGVLFPTLTSCLRSREAVQFEESEVEIRVKDIEKNTQETDTQLQELRKDNDQKKHIEALKGQLAQLKEALRKQWDETLSDEDAAAFLVSIKQIEEVEKVLNTLEEKLNDSEQGATQPWLTALDAAFGNFKAILDEQQDQLISQEELAKAIASADQFLKELGPKEEVIAPEQEELGKKATKQQQREEKLRELAEFKQKVLKDSSQTRKERRKELAKEVVILASKGDKADKVAYVKALLAPTTEEYATKKSFRTYKRILVDSMTIAIRRKEKIAWKILAESIWKDNTRAGDDYFNDSAREKVFNTLLKEFAEAIKSEEKTDQEKAEMLARLIEVIKKGNVFGNINDQVIAGLKADRDALTTPAPSVAELDIEEEEVEVKEKKDLTFPQDMKSTLKKARSMSDPGPATDWDL